MMAFNHPTTTTTTTSSSSSPCRSVSLSVPREEGDNGKTSWITTMDVVDADHEESGAAIISDGTSVPSDDPASSPTATSSTSSSTSNNTSKVDNKKTTSSKKKSPRNRKSGRSLKHKRRYCKKPGCDRIVKSQGLCQRHGAKPRKCKISSCTKQAQGNFDGMCKLHYKTYKSQQEQRLQGTQNEQEGSTGVCIPIGNSVYDRIIPESLAWQASGAIMPLEAHLKSGYEGPARKPLAWHRNEERQSRGLNVAVSHDHAAAQQPLPSLEAWERELVMTEVLLLSGNASPMSTSPASLYTHLAWAWGCEPGFHHELVQDVCRQRGSSSAATATAGVATVPSQTLSSTTPWATKSNSFNHQGIMGAPPSSAAPAPVQWNQQHLTSLSLLPETEQPLSLYAPTSTMSTAAAPNTQEFMASMMDSSTVAAFAAAAFEPSSSSVVKNISSSSSNNNSNESLLLNVANFGATAYNDSLEADILNLAGCGGGTTNSISNNTAHETTTASQQAHPPPSQKQQQLGYCQVIDHQDDSGVEADDEDLSGEDEAKCGPRYL